MALSTIRASRATASPAKLALDLTEGSRATGRWLAAPGVHRRTRSPTRTTLAPSTAHRNHAT